VEMGLVFDTEVSMSNFSGMLVGGLSAGLDFVVCGGFPAISGLILGRRLAAVFFDAAFFALFLAAFFFAALVVVSDFFVGKS